MRFLLSSKIPIPLRYTSLDKTFKQKQMNLSKIGLLAAIIITLNSCAANYRMINPDKLSYNSNDRKNEILLEYKYDLLPKKYAKKERRKDVRLVAIKITNNSENDITFGKEIKLTYDNGNEFYLIRQDKVFFYLKQNIVPYLLYGLLTPMTLNFSKNRKQTSSVPIGLFLGPVLAGGNMAFAATANKQFRTELYKFNLMGVVIKPGETKIGLIGIASDNHDAIKIKLE